MGMSSPLKRTLMEAMQEDSASLPTVGKNPANPYRNPYKATPSQPSGDSGTLLNALLTDPLSPPEAPLYGLFPEPVSPSAGPPAGATPPDEAVNTHKTDFDDTLSGRGMVPDEARETPDPVNAPSSALTREQSVTLDKESLDTEILGGRRMADLSAYKDLSKAPMSFGDEEPTISALASSDSAGFGGALNAGGITPTQHFLQEVSAQEVDTEFSGNVKTLIRLVNELPEGVTKQTGAQIIRLTMEAMGISMENVLSEAQSAQSEMLDAVRANIKKIEEYKTVIRKLETDIKYYQGKANELSEIIDLFILSNTSSSGQKVPFPDDLTR